MIPVSRKRLFTTTVGIILAVAIIFTSYTLGNNMARYQLYYDIENNPYQISVVGSGNYTAIMKAYNQIENLSNVRQTLLHIWVEGYYALNNITIAYQRGLMVNYFKGYDIKIVAGTYPKNNHEVLITKFAYNSHALNIGDKVQVIYTTQSEQMFFENYTVVGVADVKEPLKQDNGQGDMYEGIIVTKEAMKYLGEKGMPYQAGYLVAIEPQYLLSSKDYKEVQKKIDDMSYEVRTILVSNGVYYMGYGNSAEWESNANMYSLLFAIFYSLPVIVMGVYLSNVGVEIEFLERRREFGVLKIRGATGKEISKMILFEALIYSLVGGIIGYLLGEALAYLSNIMFFHYPYFLLDIGIWPLIASIFLSIALFLASIYSPLKKIKKEPIVSLISHYAQAFKEAEYTKRNRDLWLSALFWGYMILVLWLSKNVNFYGGLNIIVILAFILISTMFFMFPLILIMLPLVMSRLLTMGTSKVYRVIASGVSKIFKTSGELAEKGIERSPKRTAYLAFILAFILTLSTFIAIAMDNYNYTAEIEQKAQVGGDMLIQVHNDIPWDILNDSSLVSKYVVIYRYGDEYGAPLYIANMQKYMNTIYNGKLFLKEGKLDGSGVVLSLSYAKMENVGVGDMVAIQVNQTSQYYKVEAIVYSFPGLPTDYVVDKSKPTGIPDTIIIRSSNITALEKALDKKGYSYELPPKKDEMQAMQSQFMNTLLLYLVILGAASIFIVQYSSLLNRRGEIALYKVRGARNRQIAAMLMTEGITVIILSLIIGVAVGMALAYMISSMSSVSSYIPEIFIIGATFLIYTGVLVLAYMISQYILSYIFARTKPSEVIRGLGGEI
ncbi:ABC transporter permease [Candidatus Aciduliprofundum boonei]|uniref:Uncharacterized protein n=1 Tax=Aciduliprofundum boonei (strain DSM 19572 / T469) TaxID=439481 RepID=B5IA75_ACIB4|nr:FtsX-like permease family protein [Candidatus Aciduliprofundum boonei]ADD08288.1 protein of unknown function DUF214 [Aciduliprofundum boonei T469]EDY36911.1 efflux ABC transporter, permease protein [Aciduliprofundum boonei T469]HII54635.1 ABC transporter permease [Candidatus Aciduliprofundum boonei]